MIGTLVHILQCSLASSHRAERGDIMQDFSVCVWVSFSLFLSFLISILYVNVKKNVFMALQWPRYVLQYMVICFYVRFQRIDIMKQKFEAENNSVLFKTILCPFKFSTTPSF